MCRDDRNFISNWISAIPAEISKLSNLKRLCGGAAYHIAPLPTADAKMLLLFAPNSDIGSGNLTSLPRELGSLPQLEIL